MPNVKYTLKVMLALSVWSFVMLGLFKLHGRGDARSGGAFGASQLSGRFLLQKDSRYGSMEPTSTTTDRIPYDVLVDNRASECSFKFKFIICV